MLTDIHRGEVGALAEHPGHVGHLFGVERAQVEGREVVAAAEHRVHVRHLLGVEHAHVEVLQRFATAEHLPHGGHVGGVHVVHVGNLVQAAQPFEPAISRLRICLGERGVEDHRPDGVFHLIEVPLRSAQPHVQPEHLPVAGAAKLVAVEGQRAVVVNGIGRRRQIAFGSDNSIPPIDVIVVVGLSVFAHEFCATLEHISGTHVSINMAHVPSVAYMDSDELVALVKHLMCIGHITCVEGAQVENSKPCAVGKHRRHGGHLAGVERHQVELGQARTATEHGRHVGHLFGVEVADALNVLQGAHAFKPGAGARRTGEGKRGVDGHVADAGCIRCPGGLRAGSLQVVGGDTGALTSVAVVDEGQRAVGKEHVRPIAQIALRLSVGNGIRTASVVLLGIGRAVAALQQ